MDSVPRSLAFGALLAVAAGAVLFARHAPHRTRLGPLSPPDGEEALPGACQVPREASWNVPLEENARNCARTAIAASAVDATSFFLVEVRSLARGTPVEGVVVELECEGRIEVFPKPARTDGLGRASFAIQRGAVPTRLRAHAGARSFAAERLLVPGAAREADRPEVLFVETLRGIVRGVVRDEAGRPFPGAEVAVWWGPPEDLERTPFPEADCSAYSDFDGAFELEVRSTDFLLAASAPARACLTRLHGRFSEENAPTDFELVLVPAVTIAGRMIKVDGRPAAGVVLRSEPSCSSTATAIPSVVEVGPEPIFGISDANGRFELAGATPREWSLVAFEAGLVRWRGAWAPGSGELVVRLEPGARLSGVIFAQDGRPASGTTVQLAGRNARRAVTDATGRFELTELTPDARAALIARGPENQVGRIVPLAIGESGEQHFELWLQPPLPLAGNVVDTSGRPLARASIHIRAPRRNANEPRLGRGTPLPGADLARAHCDEQGRFRIEGLAPGELELSVRDAEGRDRTPASLVLPGDLALRVVVDEPHTSCGSLSGRVVDARTLRPVRSFSVLPLSGADGLLGGHEHHVLADSGQFELVGLPARELELRVFAPGFAPWRGRIDARVAVPYLELRMEPEAEARVRVVDASGAAVVGAEVNAFRLDRGESVPLRSGPRGLHERLWTDAEGRARLHGLPQVELELRVEAEGGQTTWIFTPDAHAVNEVRVQLES